MKMRNSLRYITIIAAILLLVLPSCLRDDSREESTRAYTGLRISMNLRFAAGAEVADDSTVKIVRVIVFNNEGQLVYNDTSTATVIGGVCSVETEAAPGINNFYVFCNETEELGTKLAAVRTEAEIEVIDFAAIDIVPPLPMYAKVLNAFVSAKSNGSDAKVTIDNVTTDYLPVKVDRMLARINFTAIKNIATPDEDFTVEELRIRVCRMPSKMTVSKNIYTANKWSEGQAYLGTGQLSNNGMYTITDGVYSIPADLNSITFPDIYIPEYLLSVAADKTMATYLRIDAKCLDKDGKTDAKTYMYQVCIGEQPPKSFHLKRNNNYKIFATITGKGAMGIYAEIQAMEQYDVPVNWKPVDGLVVVSDRLSDYDITTGTSKNVNVWSDYTAYSGILKSYHSDTGYSDVHFKYGSVIAVRNDIAATVTVPFAPPTSVDHLGDILWYPLTYGNPYDKIKGWSDIPYVTSGDIPVDNKQLSLGLGDPCKLVGLSPNQILNEGVTDNKQWHMATTAEYETLMANLASDILPTAYNNRGYYSFHYILLPVVKTRDVNGVLSAAPAETGNYWLPANSKEFAFSGADPFAGGLTNGTATQGLTVRCVRNSIPTTALATTNSIGISYRGNTDSGVPVSVASNMPYWTATLVEDPTDTEIGDSREFDDFSFAAGDTNVKATSGSFNQDFRVYLKRKESRLSRTYRVRIMGAGFNGVRDTVHVTVTQSGYSISGQPTFSPEIGSTLIPADGATYAVSVDLSPKDIKIPAGNLQIEAIYQGIDVGKSNIISTSPDTYNYTGFTLTVAANSTPDQIGIDFIVYLLDSPYGAKTRIGGTYSMQYNK